MTEEESELAVQIIAAHSKSQNTSRHLGVGEAVALVAVCITVIGILIGLAVRVSATEVKATDAAQRVHWLELSDRKQDIDISVIQSKLK